MAPCTAMGLAPCFWPRPTAWFTTGSCTSNCALHAKRGCRECSALYVMRLSNGRIGRITRKRFNALMPAWSPDGVHIVWARAPSIDAPLALYMMRSDTSAVRRVDAGGASPAEARRRVRAETGGGVAVKEAVRDQWTGVALDALLLDARYAWRGL